MRRDAEPYRAASTLLVSYFHQRLLDAGLDGQAQLLESAPGLVFSPATGDEDGIQVLAHLDEALARSTPTVPGPVRQAVGLLASAASWRRTESYVRRPPSADFLDNYAHTTLLGPADGGGTSPASAESGVAIGLVLLGPGVVYPPHHHPADEVYLPLHEIEWTHDRDETPAAVAPGTVVHHAPWKPHSMNVGRHPALLCYLWTGDVTTASRFCD